MQTQDYLGNSVSVSSIPGVGVGGVDVGSGGGGGKDEGGERRPWNITSLFIYLPTHPFTNLHYAPSNPQPLAWQTLPLHTREASGSLENLALWRQVTGGREGKEVELPPLFTTASNGSPFATASRFPSSLSFDFMQDMNKDASSARWGQMSFLA